VRVHNYLSFFGHLSQADPGQDHHRALQACILGPAGDGDRGLAGTDNPGLEPLKMICDH